MPHLEHLFNLAVSLIFDLFDLKIQQLVSVTNCT